VTKRLAVFVVGFLAWGTARAGTFIINPITGKADYVSTSTTTGAADGTGGWTLSSSSTQTATTANVGIGGNATYILDILSNKVGGIYPTDFIRLSTTRSDESVGVILSASAPWTYTPTSQSGTTADLTCTMYGVGAASSGQVYSCDGNPGVLAYSWFNTAIYVKNPVAATSGTRGEVGINTTTPGAQLHIKSRSAPTEYSFLVSSQTTTTVQFALWGDGRFSMRNSSYSWMNGYGTAGQVIVGDGNGGMAWGTVTSTITGGGGGSSGFAYANNIATTGFTVSIGTDVAIAGSNVVVSTPGTTATVQWVTGTTGHTNGDGVSQTLDANGFDVNLRESRYMRFMTSGVERMRIHAGGSIAMGSVNSIYGLEIASKTIFNGGSSAGFTTTGTVTANAFVGSGGGITNLTPGNLLAGQIPDATKVSTGSILANGVATSTTVLYGNGQWAGISTSGSDNLGNHVATTSLDMAGFAVRRSSSVEVIGSGNAVIYSTNPVEIQTGVSASTITFSTGGVQLPEITAPGVPPSGMGRFYVKSSDSKAYFQDDSGTEYDLTAAAGSSGGWTVVNSTSYATNDVVVGTSASQGIKLRVVQQTSGGIVQALATSTGTAATDYISQRTIQGAATTTDASTASIVSITVPADSAVNVRAMITAMRVGGTSGDASDAASYNIRTAVKRSTSGAVTFVGGASSYQDVLAYESTPTWNAYASTTATTVEFVAKGLASNTIKWFASADYVTVSTNAAAAGGGGGSLTFDTATFNSATSGTTINVGPHTVANQSNRLMLYLISNRRNTGQSVSTITFNGSPTQYIDDGNGTTNHAEAHSLINPTIGVNNSTVTFSATLSAAGVGALGFYNVNTSSAVRSYGNTDGSGATSASQTLPTVSGDICANLTVVFSPTTVTKGAGETELFNQTIGTEQQVLISIKTATGSTTTMSSTFASSSYRTEMVCVR
jgi:hypothetical protein